MRTIKFRGQRCDTKEFIFGDLAKMWNGLPFIMPKCFFATKDLGFDEDNPEEVQKMLNSKELAIGGFIEVFPETVGQFTGLLDKNGNEAFEGDKIKGICVLTDSNGYDSKFEIEGVINYSDEYSAFAFTNNIKAPLENYCNFMYQLSKFEIIGNIHTTPEQLTK